jgi:hypothetical protein
VIIVRLVEKLDGKFVSLGILREVEEVEFWKMLDLALLVAEEIVSHSIADCG